VKLSALTPDSRNANKGTPRGRKMVRESLKRYGAGRSILLDKSGNIIAGNKTVEGAMAVGLEDCQIVKSDGTKLIAVQRTDLDINDRAARELGIADNRASELGLDWDLGVLKEFKVEEVDLAPFWDSQELSGLLGLPVEEAPDPKLDQAAELQGKWGTKLGQLWLIGPHRLLCGDSTSAADVARVFASNSKVLANVVYTDPPYGVGYDGGTVRREKLAGDSSVALYGPTCQMAADFSTADAALYLWHAGVKGIAAAAAAAAAAAGWEIRCELVWNKNLAQFGAGWEIRCELVWNKNLAQFGALSAQYKQKHEPCYYCHKRGKAPAWYGPTNEVTVWDCDRSAVNEHHPTQKPVALAVRALANSSASGDVILDLFLGSGSTMCAAEQTHRTCYALEIEPKYVAVALQRLADMGLKPELAT
jgi:DNA modification methylase